MAATVKTYSYHGVAPGVGADAPNVRFKLADNEVQDANNPCIQPSAGTNYSYWKSIALYAEIAPATSISNVKIYTDGALGWTGSGVDVGDDQSDTYQQATGGVESGDEMVASHAQIASKTNLFTYTVGAQLSVALSASWGDTTGRITRFLVLQASLTSTAVGGLQAAETITWQFDEV